MSNKNVATFGFAIPSYWSFSDSLSSFFPFEMNDTVSRDRFIHLGIPSSCFHVEDVSHIWREYTQVFVFTHSLGCQGGQHQRLHLFTHLEEVLPITARSPLGSHLWTFASKWWPCLSCIAPHASSKLLAQHWHIPDHQVRLCVAMSAWWTGRGQDKLL